MINLAHHSIDSTGYGGGPASATFGQRSIASNNEIYKIPALIATETPKEL